MPWSGLIHLIPKYMPHNLKLFLLSYEIILYQRIKHMPRQRISPITSAPRGTRPVFSYVPPK